MTLDNLRPNTRYYYRMRFRKSGETEFQARNESTFHTQRVPGSAFIFAIQGDSHPERAHQNDPELYTRTLRNTASDQPDDSEAAAQHTLLHILAVSENGLSCDELVAQSGFSPAAVQQALNTLARHDVLAERDGTWSFTVELMRRWVAHKNANF